MKIANVVYDDIAKRGTCSTQHAITQHIDGFAFAGSIHKQSATSDVEVAGETWVGAYNNVADSITVDIASADHLSNGEYAGTIKVDIVAIEIDAARQVQR